MSIVQHQEVEDYLKFQASLGYVVKTNRKSKSSACSLSYAQSTDAERDWLGGGEGPTVGGEEG